MAGSMLGDTSMVTAASTPGAAMSGGQFRLDYIWISTPIAPRLMRTGDDHRPRSTKITDHSALYVELDSPVEGA